jgi:alkylation response protein AidB-like acyl-CoA dehydrogenase
MDFHYSDDQRMLSDTLERFLSDRHGLQQRGRLLKDPAAEAALWREIADLGLIGAAYPEDVGGFATSSADAAIVMDRLGCHLVTQPYLYTAVLCGRLLIDGLPNDARAEEIGAVIAGERHLALAACGKHALHSPQDTTFEATRDGAGWSISGRMPVVMNGDRADRLIVAARTAGQQGERDGVTLFLVDAGAVGIARRSFRLIDGFGASDVVIENLAVSRDNVVGEIDNGCLLLDTAFDHATAAVCAEAVGAMEYLLPATVEYARTRVQYDAPLSGFQVLQHKMADMYIQTQTAKSMALVAAMALDGDSLVRTRLVSAAKAQVGRSAKFVGYQAVQIHGGMGVSEELDIGHHYIRLNVIDRLFGDTSFHLDRFGSLTPRSTP